jgi:hypothetical protein
MSEIIFNSTNLYAWDNLYIWKELQIQNIYEIKTIKIKIDKIHNYIWRKVLTYKLCMIDNDDCYYFHEQWNDSDDFLLFNKDWLLVSDNEMVENEFWWIREDKAYKWIHKNYIYENGRNDLYAEIKGDMPPNF